jgi:LemA protein
MGLLILLGIVVAIIFFFVGIYNGLVTARNGYKNSFAQIDVQLQRRYDLIPNLVETAKGYMKHERETLEAVIAARGAAVSGLAAAKANPGDPAAMQQLTGAENQLTATLGRLFAVAEAYPDLKANQNFMQLQSELADLENKIAAARRFFNNATGEYNASIQRFPAVLIAGAAGFTPREFFDVGADRAALQSAPQVKFS